MVIIYHDKLHPSIFHDKFKLKGRLMTFSILAHDPDANIVAGAAATGSLCVGGWVLRGDVQAGMSASQGAAPSTIWGEEVLSAMKTGQNAQAAVDAVTSGDGGRAFRQLSALDLAGRGACFTGQSNTPLMGSRVFPGGVVAGNMLGSEKVLDSMINGFQTSRGRLAERLLAALRAGERAGSDARGLMSSALLALSPDRAPLTLRIDYSETPLDDLEDLYARATSGEYFQWSRQVPTLNNPERTLD